MFKNIIALALAAAVTTVAFAETPAVTGATKAVETAKPAVAAPAAASPAIATPAVTATAVTATAKPEVLAEGKMHDAKPTVKATTHKTAPKSASTGKMEATPAATGVAPATVPAVTK